MAEITAERLVRRLARLGRWVPDLWVALRATIAHLKPIMVTHTLTYALLNGSLWTLVFATLTVVWVTLFL